MCITFPAAQGSGSSCWGRVCISSSPGPAAVYDRQKAFGSAAPGQCQRGLIPHQLRTPLCWLAAVLLYPLLCCCPAAWVRVRPAYAGEGRYFVRVPEGTNKDRFAFEADNMRDRLTVGKMHTHTHRLQQSALGDAYTISATSCKLCCCVGVWPLPGCSCHKQHHKWASPVEAALGLCWCIAAIDSLPGLRCICWLLCLTVTSPQICPDQIRHVV